jgi:hypothetical protein
MYKLTLSLLLLVFSLSGQTKKPASKTKAAPVEADSVQPAKIDTTDPVADALRAERKFGVYTRKPRKPDNRMKLCLNLVSPSSMLNLCFNDSVCKYPERSKILFEKAAGDSTYLLVYVDAFTKVDNNPSCDAGHETKLIYIRWNTATNKAVWKQRSISSCARAITNMTKESIADWDGNSVLTVNYHRGGTNFVELKFDPQNYLLGFQSPNETGSGN